MTITEYEEAKAEAAELWERGIFTYPEYEAIIKILFERKYGIKVSPRGYYKRSI